MTDAQITLAKIIFGMLMQFFLALVATGIWIGVTIALLLNPHWPMATAESLLTLTLGYVYKYFFSLGKSG
jgi:hypothetical protein